MSLKPNPSAPTIKCTYLSAKAAAELDKDLMSPDGGFSIDQLMELAGLSVSQAVYKVHPPSMGRKVLVICGPGNNGGDGLVAARHLHHYGYRPEIYYPKPGKSELYQRLQTQLHNLRIPFHTSSTFPTALSSTHHIIDAIFGFSFSGAVRAPFDDIISRITTLNPPKPVTSVDIPSGWDVDNGPTKLTEAEGKEGEGVNVLVPSTLVSLTAPKPCVKFLEKGRTRHFLGGRFVSEKIRSRYGLKLERVGAETPGEEEEQGEDGYPGIDQVVELLV